MRFFQIENPTVRFGAVEKRKSSGAVRCGFQFCNPTVWYGFVIYPTVRFGMVFRYFVNPTVQFGFVINPTVRVGAVLNNRKFHVRFGAVLENRKYYGAVRFSVSYGSIRFGSPLNRFFYGAVPIPVGETVQHTLFYTVHRMYKPYKAAVSYGFRTFYQGTNKTTVSLRCGAPYE